MACVCMTTVIGTSVPMTGLVQAASHDDPSVNVMLDEGGYKTEVFGIGTDDWGQTWPDRKEKLPPATTYLTDHYRETVGTVPTSDWASSVVFDKYSESLYAHPLAFRAASNGMQMASPAVVDSTSYVDGEPSVESLLNDETVELVVGADGFSAVDARVDKTTDWTYEIVMANSAGTSSMRSTLAKGTPYAYYTFDNLSPTISLGAGATDLAIYKNNANILGVSLTNKKDGKTHYYGVYAPSGTTWTNAGGKLTANLPSGKSYLSIAILPDNSNEAFSLYEQYAFNFITDTKVEWEYLENSSKVNTRYSVTTTNMEDGTIGGDTIIALYPHQWRYLMDGTGTFTQYTYDTIRGTMKTIEGNSYLTEMTFNGMLTGLPVTEDETDKGNITDQLGYLWNYRKDKEDPKWIVNLEGQYGGFDTYWVGKNLNTLSEAIFLADQLSADETVKGWKNDIVEGVANYLQFWFNPGDMYVNGDYVDDYFYYHEDYGTLIGYPASYSTDKEVNDHHFHYGYWIKAAAAVAMNDPEWAKSWGGMVYEMISDIANTNRDGSSYNENSPAKYPFLRNFDIYEGHSWASGVANYEYDENGKLIDEKGGLAGGNNQESSSEAVNAWASLVLWGEAVGDKRIRDLGIYLYTTEVAAVEEYYYDVHDEVFTDKYEDKDNYNIQTVTRLFGGRYDHTAWWTENSIEVTTITMLPLSGATFYMGRHKNKVKAVVDSISENSNQWKHFVDTKDQSCANFGKTDMLTDPETNQDVIAMYYAYYDADAAMEMWDSSDEGKVENGESRAHTMAYITSLKNYGTQNFDITGSSPFSLVLEKDGKKTYVAENHTGEDQRVYFSDGTYVDVPANSTYGGDKTGDGENPNQDDSQLLPSKKKFNLEVYCEKLEGSGYDMTSRTVNVRSEENTYTYKPAQINGFTFDSANTNNHLTVNVTEGTVETVKVYYTRNSYTISYTLNGGSVSGTNPTSYRYGQTLSLTAPTLDGYEFIGWFTSEDFSGAPVTGITATTSGNLKLYAKFLKEGAVTGVSLDKTSANLKAGETVSLTATVEPAGAKDKTVTWTSSKPEVATVSQEGLVKAVAEGSTVITVKTKDGEFIAQCDIFVSAASTGPGYTRAEKGVEIDKDGNLVLYVTKTSMGSVVAFYGIYGSEEEAKGKKLSDLPGYNMTQSSDGAFEYKAVKADKTKYLAYAFNGGIQETPIVIAISDIPSVDGGSSEPVTAGFTVNHYLQNEKGEYALHTSLKRTGVVNETVTESPVEYSGYMFNSSKSKVSGTVVANGSLVLDFYYDLVDDRESASYTIKHYVQNREQNGYDVYDEETKTAKVGNTVKVDPLVRPGIKFNASRSHTSGEVTADGKLELTCYYDRETYNITYELNGGTDNPSSNRQTYVYGVGLPSLEGPNKDGYTFGGWYTNADFSGAQVTQITRDSTGDITLYAKWVERTGDEKTAHYTVLFYEQNTQKNGYRLADRSVKTGTVGETVSAASTERTGFTLNPDAAGSKVSGTVTEDNKLELSLYYDRNTYNIIYELDGGTNNSLNAATYLYGLAMYLEDPSKDGYIFAGWFEDAAHTTRIRSIYPGVSGDITVYAAWQEEEKPGAVRHSITYVVNGGVRPSSLINYYEEGVGRVLGEPTYEGREFLGWYTTETFEEGTKITEIPATATTDYVLFAKWSDPEPDVIMHNITYVVYGETQWKGTFEEGKEMRLMQPTREGYTFLGWYTTPDFIAGTGISRISATQKEDITVYARWSKNEEPKDPENYTVTFNSAGGSAVPSQTVEEGKTAIQPAAPTRAGFVFKGWMLGNAAYNFASPVNGNITLTAKWEAVKPPVASVKVTGIKISGISKKIAAGKKVQLTAAVLPVNATDPSVTWSIKADKNAKYASVDAKTGLVRTKKSGKNKTITIIATANDGSGVKAEYKIKLMQKAVKKITLKASATTVKAGKKVRIRATVTPKASAKKINSKLKWESSNPKYATVTSKGLVKTKKAGKKKTVKITARATDGSNKKKTIKIKLK